MFSVRFPRPGPCSRWPRSPQQQRHRPPSAFTVSRTSWGDPIASGSGLSNDHTDGTSPRARRSRELHGRESRSSRRAARRWTAARRHRTGQSRSRGVLDGPGPPRRRIASHVVDRRSAERPHAAVDGRSAGTASRESRSRGRRAGSTRRSRRLLRRPFVARALHHTWFRGRAAADALHTIFDRQHPATCDVHEMVHRRASAARRQRVRQRASISGIARPFRVRHAASSNPQLNGNPFRAPAAI